MLRVRERSRADSTQILDLVPTAPGYVLQVVLQALPHRRACKEVHLQFLRNAFKLAELSQAAPIRDGLLLGVIGRLLEVLIALSSSLTLGSRGCRLTWRSDTRTWMCWTTLTGLMAR
jgi:hypothetical protein